MRSAVSRRPEAPLRGTVRVPGDKSMAHRAAILAAAATGPSRILGVPDAGDCRSTLAALRVLGVEMAMDGDEVRIVGPAPFRTPGGPVDCGRSATTMRLLAGVLAGRPLRATLTGDAQLLQRPMERVAAPLRRMGARIETSPGGTPPLVIGGSRLRGVAHRLEVASAQVKSAILLAGLHAEGGTLVSEPHPSRDHTERLLAWLGVAVRRPDPRSVGIVPASPAGFELRLPGDVSSASFLAAAAALVPGSEVIVEDVGLNPTRTGFLRALAAMGAGVETEVLTEDPEPRGRLRVRPGPLAGIAVGTAEVPGIVDELPLLALVATAAEGETRVTGAGELRVKESDRIAGLAAGLRALGARAEELPDGFVVEGPTPLGGGEVDARGDHRLAMTFALAGLVATGPVRVAGMARAADSFPGFLRTLEGLR